MCTNGILQHRTFGRDPDPLGTGAGSFKRVLGGCAATIDRLSSVPFENDNNRSRCTIPTE
jgi:hypothetical protein